MPSCRYAQGIELNCVLSLLLIIVASTTSIACLPYRKRPSAHEDDCQSIMQVRNNMQGDFWMDANGITKGFMPAKRARDGENVSSKC